MTSMYSAPTAPAAAPESAPIRPNMVGRIGLILVAAAIAAPLLSYIFVMVNGGWPGERLGGDISGLSGLSALFLAFGVAAFAAPVAIAGVVLGIVSLTRQGRGRVPGILAIVFGTIPSLAIFNWLIIGALYNSAS